MSIHNDITGDDPAVVRSVAEIMKQAKDRPTEPAPIAVGDEVRSFDFDSREVSGPGACYIEGVVEAIGPVEGMPGPDRYTIRPSRYVFGGKHADLQAVANRGTVYPPVNGLEHPLSASGLTDGVVVIRSAEQRNPHVLRKDGVEVFRGPANDALTWLHRNEPYSWDHAFKYEGYTLDPAGQG